MLYLSNPLGNLQKFFFFTLTDVHYLQFPFFLLFLTILDGNICTTYFTPYKFIQCIIQKKMAWFSKESCLIKNINYYLMLFDSSGHCHGLGKWAGWLDFYYILAHLLFFLSPPFLPQLFSRLLAFLEARRKAQAPFLPMKDCSCFARCGPWALASASPRSFQKCRILDPSPDQLN